MIAAHGNGRRVAQHAVAEDDQFRRAAADIEQAAAQFALILREAGFRRSQRLEHRVRDFHARLIDGDHQILHGRSRGSDEVHVHFQAPADHAQRIANIVVRVEQKFLRQDVQHHAILGKRDIARGIHGVAHVVAVDVPRPVPQRDAAAAVHAANVAAGDAGDDPLDGHAGDAFGFFDRAPHRSRRRADVGDQSLAQALGFRRAHGHKFRARFGQLADDGARLRAAHIQRDQILFFFRQPAAPSTYRLPGPVRRARAENLQIRLALLSRRCHMLSRCLAHALRHALRRALLHAGRDGLRFRIHHHLPREPQIHRIDASRAGSPLVDIFREQVIPVAEIRIAKVHQNRRSACRTPFPVR